MSQLLRKHLTEVNDLKLSLLAGNEFQGFTNGHLKTFDEELPIVGKR